MSTTETRYVETVRGPVAPESLGVTLPHEHLFADLRTPLWPVEQQLLDVYLTIHQLEEEPIHEELRDIYAEGVRTLVDCTTETMGRRADALKRASEVTGVNVVCATGIYINDFHPRNIETASVDELAEVMIRELEQGIGETGIRPGVIKLASSTSPLRDGEMKAFQAGGKAAAATGTPITTHSSRGACLSGPGTMGLEQLDVFEAAGVDPSHVIIGHNDHNTQLDHHLDLARRGAFIQIDHLGAVHFCPEERRAQAVADLFERGHGDKVLLSHDIARVTDYRANGGRGRGYLMREFVPLLRTFGLSEKELNQVLVENPARALTKFAPRA